MACVYWIRKSEHADIFSQGYIGFSSNSAEHRYKEHIAATKYKNYPTIISSAIKKYGHKNLIVETVCIGGKDYCLAVENKLRPNPNIGWNLEPGGQKPPSMAGKKFPDHAKLKISALHKGKITSEDTKRKMSLAHTGKKMSAESCEKMRLNSLGRKHSEETKAKMRSSRLRNLEKI